MTDGRACVFLATSINIKRIRLKPPSRVASLSQVCVCVCVFMFMLKTDFHLLFHSSYVFFCLSTGLFIYFFGSDSVRIHTHTHVHICIEPSIY